MPEVHDQHKVLEEKDSITFLADRSLFTSVAQLFHECVFEMLNLKLAEIP